MKKLLFLLFFTFVFNLVNAQTWQDYRTKMIQLFNEKKYAEAIQAGENAIQIIKADKSLLADYLGTLNNLSYLYLQNRNYKKAEKGYSEVIKQVIPILGKKHKISAKALGMLGEVYLETNNLNQAEKYLTESHNLKLELLTKEDPELTHSYRKLKELYLKKRKYKKSIAYQDTILNNIKQIYGENNSIYIKLLNERALLNKNFGKSKIAVEQFKKVIRKEEKTNGKYTSDWFIYARNMVIALSEMSQLDDAIALYEEICENSKKKYGEDLNYALYINELGVMYYNNAMYNKSMTCYDEAKKIWRNKLGEKSKKYASTLKNEAVLLFRIGNYIKSEALYLQAKKTLSDLKLKNDPLYAGILNGLAVIYYETGSFKKSIQLYQESAKIYEKAGEIYSDGYFTVLTNTAELYDKTQQRIKAGEIYSKALLTGQKIYGNDNIDFAKLLTKVASHFRLSKNYKVSDSLFKKAIDIQLNTVGKNHPDYATSLNNLGTLYLDEGKHSKSRKAFKEAQKIDAKLFGTKSRPYTVALLNLAAVYFDMKKYRKAESYIKDAAININAEIKNTISFLTGDEIEAYIKDIGFLYEMFYSFYLFRYEKNKKLSAPAYDIALLRKGLLLQSEKRLRQAILKTKDKKIIKKYLDFVRIKAELGKIYTSPDQTDSKKTKTLEDKAQKLELELTRNSSVFKKNKDSKFVTWKDVQKNLKKGEAAIEFISYRNYDLEYTKDIYYVALILRPEYKYPKMVCMFEEKELNKLLDKGNAKNDVVYVGSLYHKKNSKAIGYKPKTDTKSIKLDSLIWAPVKKHLKGVKTIYLSPAGQLHRISFAALSDNNKYISDLYKINIISSTKLLINKKNKTKKVNTAYIYGGIDYDAQTSDIEKIVSNNYKKEYLENADISSKTYFTNFGTRGGAWNYLSGTKIEMEEIDEILQKHGQKTLTLSGVNAIEESIKQFDGKYKSPGIIHIATHGFFFPDTEEKERKVFSEEIYEKPKGSGSLFRSGLLFSGANRTWTNQELPRQIDDGILTAYEVANLNLYNTELVVLSACETGLGDIKGSEGVYGLQRSFKIAGVDYIIMSLWQVPDKQTVDLMKAFYTYKSQGVEIGEAFRKAQNDLKKKYLPYYWAAFVLIQ